MKSSSVWNAYILTGLSLIITILCLAVSIPPEIGELIIAVALLMAVIAFFIGLRHRKERWGKVIAGLNLVFLVCMGVWFFSGADVVSGHSTNLGTTSRPL